jgi:putative membrane protein
MPPGFLGTDADILMDLVVCSLAIVLPLLGVSWRWVRAKHYLRHRNLMVGLGSTLAVVVGLFEIDVRLAGGAFGLAKNSGLAGTTLMIASIWIHLAIAASTALIWLTLIIVSLRRFPKPPKPTENFSATHRFWGRIGMVAMTLTGITGIELYVVLFCF